MNLSESYSSLDPASSLDGRLPARFFQSKSSVEAQEAPVVESTKTPDVKPEEPAVVEIDFESSSFDPDKLRRSIYEKAFCEQKSDDEGVEFRKQPENQHPPAKRHKSDAEPDKLSAKERRRRWSSIDRPTPPSLHPELSEVSPLSPAWHPSPSETPASHPTKAHLPSKFHKAMKTLSAQDKGSLDLKDTRTLQDLSVSVPSNGCTVQHTEQMNQYYSNPAEVFDGVQLSTETQTCDVTNGNVNMEPATENIEPMVESNNDSMKPSLSTQFGNRWTGQKENTALKEDSSQVRGSGDKTNTTSRTPGVADTGRTQGTNDANSNLFRRSRDLIEPKSDQSEDGNDVGQSRMNQSEQSRWPRNYSKLLTKALSQELDGCDEPDNQTELISRTLELEDVAPEFQELKRKLGHVSPEGANETTSTKFRRISTEETPGLVTETLAVLLGRDVKSETETRVFSSQSKTNTSEISPGKTFRAEVFFSSPVKSGVDNDALDITVGTSGFNVKTVGRSTIVRQIVAPEQEMETAPPEEPEPSNQNRERNTQVTSEEDALRGLWLSLFF